MLSLWFLLNPLENIRWVRNNKEHWLSSLEDTDDVGRTYMFFMRQQKVVVTPYIRRVMKLHAGRHLLGNYVTSVLKQERIERNIAEAQARQKRLAGRDRSHLRRVK